MFRMATGAEQAMIADGAQGSEAGHGGISARCLEWVCPHAGIRELDLCD